ncbi:MAG: FKBP-type peptidyl-prolyl cis-trans isomerase [Clostridia bacterium]|nr:FKBP-type peptidyl-prolyl cis-trans isomerase [Clostridia bacterium]
MKRILSIVLILVLCLCFVGCKQDKGRKLYNVDLEKYVELGEYKGIKIDTKSEEYRAIYDSAILSDIINNKLNKEESITKGTVNPGDIANIDFVGKKDGVAFDGGTASGYELTIGSGSFIEGFEEGLVGKEIGTTVDLNLTFPENYQKAELQGAKVVFTVTINSVKPTKTPEEYYGNLGFESVEKYYENIESIVTEQLLYKAVTDNSKINDYPKKDLEVLTDYYFEVYKDNIEYSYQVEFSEFLTSQNLTEAQFKEDLVTNMVKPYMDSQMLWYAMFDKEGMKLSDKDITATIKKIMVKSGDTSAKEADIREDYGDYYIESLAISDKVLEVLKENAVIS